MQQPPPAETSSSATYVCSFDSVKPDGPNDWSAYPDIHPAVQAKLAKTLTPHEYCRLYATSSIFDRLYEAAAAMAVGDGGGVERVPIFCIFSPPDTSGMISAAELEAESKTRYTQVCQELVQNVLRNKVASMKDRISGKLDNFKEVKSMFLSFIFTDTTTEAAEPPEIITYQVLDFHTLDATTNQKELWRMAIFIQNDTNQAAFVVYEKPLHAPAVDFMRQTAKRVEMAVVGGGGD